MDHPSAGWRLTRRRLLVGAAGSALLLACGGSDGDGADGAVDDDELRFLVPFFATGESEAPILRSGIEQRMPWGIGDGEGIPMPPSELPATMDFLIGAEGATPVTVPATLYSDSIPIPYYALRHNFDAPGTYSVTTTFEDQDLQRFVVVVAPEQLTLVQPGERAVPVATPTTADARGVDPICTREPPCPYHEVTLADALANGQPTVFLVSTPLFCQTAVCGPVLDVLMEAAPEKQGMNVVHAEVYADAVAKQDILSSTLAEAVTAYNLSFEPSLLAIDGAGMVVDRLDFVFDATELRVVLDKLKG